MGKFAALFGRPEFLASFHKYAAWFWFVFGVVGVLQLVFKWPRTPVIATSIAVLFFISVYANVVGHWSSNQAAKVEIKQDEEIPSKD